MSRSRCLFLPPYLLRNLAEAEPELRGASASLVVDERFRAAREREARAPSAREAAWTVHSADSSEQLPGRAVRSAGDPPSGDAPVDEAADGITASLDLLARAFGRNSYDDRGAPVLATVHYGRDYVNAFWDGAQLVFGDGDGTLFHRFTQLDVIGHEFAHALTEHSAGLRYRDQPGALNESVSDVFAACLEQWVLGQGVDEADWLIGEGLFGPGVDARALRDMADPGTAYDDPRLGSDPQVGHLRDFVETPDDNGGVHINSGIPNRAFQLAATAIGGNAWEGAGPIWIGALTIGDLGPGSDFTEFAQATVTAAGEHAGVVRDAWREVGVEPGADARPRPQGGDAGAGRDRVWVRRSGGFIGRSVEGQVDLEGPDKRAPELRTLVDEARPLPVGSDRPMPDAYTYEFDLCGEQCRVGERSMNTALRRIADIVLSEGSPSSLVE